MQRVCLERFAGIFLRHTIQTARTDEINAHAQPENQDRLQAGTYMRAVEEQPLERFPDNVHGGEQQQRGLDECGETFHFSVAVKMIRIGGLVCDAHRKISDDRGYKIQDGMQRFGQHAQAAGAHHQKYFQRDQQNGRAHRGQRGQPLFVGCAFECVQSHRGIIRCECDLAAHATMRFLSIRRNCGGVL